MKNFLKQQLDGKPPALRELAVQVLNLYLTTPLSDRNDTAENRKARLRKLIDDAVRAQSKTPPR